MTTAQATQREIDRAQEGVTVAQFRHVLGHFASGVTIVTASQAGVLIGATVSAFCSLSLDPPLVLICLSQGTASHDAIRHSGRFAVNILGEDGERLSRQFASRTPDKFAGVAHRIGVSGAPILDDATATIECRLAAQYPGGDHTIFVGAVIAASAAEARPLLYHRGRYHHLRT